MSGGTDNVVILRLIHIRFLATLSMTADASAAEPYCSGLAEEPIPDRTLILDVHVIKGSEDQVSWILWRPPFRFSILATSSVLSTMVFTPSHQ